MAAGQSTRFGKADKLLAPLGGQPLVSHAARALLSLQLDHYIAVVNDGGVERALPQFDVLHHQQNAPLSETIAAGVRRAIDLDVDRLLIALGDMPLVQPALLSEVLSRCKNQMASAATDGHHVSPPACFPKAKLPILTSLSGDRGAGLLIRDLPERQLVSAKTEQLVDVDTQRDLKHLA